MINSSPVSVLTKWLDQYLNFERTPKKNIFWLDTMEYFCKRFNHPENCAPSFHIAGSKGKGSTSKMISCILNRAGYNTGLYTSPHILNFIERIGTPLGPFSSEVYEKSVKELINGVESVIPEELPGKRPVTWFELVTLFCMICFKNAKTDWNVFEVGIGGRLDATNVINPKCCCIGPIELEHTEYLGNTLEKIAYEKAGIIKEGIPVIIAPQTASNISKLPESDVRSVFEKVAREKRAPIFFIEDILKRCEYVYKNRQYTPQSSSLENSRVLLNTEEIGMEILLDSKLFSRPIKTTLHLLGSFQAYNAATAAIAIKTVFPDMDESIIEQGLSDASLPGRFEIITNIPKYKNIPEIILDGAHTVNSIRFTMDTFNKLYRNVDTNLLFACAADKDAEDIAFFFKNRFNSVILTKPGETKASDIKRLEEAFVNANITHDTCCDFLKAIEISLKKADAAAVPLLVTGSFYLVAEVKKYLIAQKCIL